MKRGIKFLLKFLSWVGGSAVVVTIVFVIAILIANRPVKVSPPQTQTQTQKKPQDQDFTYAVPGDVWIINETNIPLMDTPQSFTDRDQFRAHLNCILESGQKVEIIRHKVVGNWKYIHTLTGLSCSGWVSGYTVKNARKI